MDPVRRPGAPDAIEKKVKFSCWYFTGIGVSWTQPPTFLKENEEYSLFVSHCDGREWDERSVRVRFLHDGPKW